MIFREERRFVAGSNLHLEQREDGGGKVLKGYAAKFNIRSLLMGNFYEIITPGAFADSLRTEDIRALYNHDDLCVLGRTSAKTLTLVEDETGLYFECFIGDRSYERDLSISLERGDITGCSFGFIAEGETVDGESEDGYPIRRLDKIKLIEVSLGVTFPAYPDTTVALRTIKAWRDQVIATRISKATSNRNRLKLLGL